MSLYKSYVDEGKLKFLKDGEEVDTKHVPAEVKEQLTEPGQEYAFEAEDDEPTEAPAPVEPEVEEDEDVRCIFSDAPAETTRYVNGLSVPVCSDHYQNKTLGEIAERVRETGYAQK